MFFCLETRNLVAGELQEEAPKSGLERVHQWGPKAGAELGNPDLAASGIDLS